MRFSHLKKIQSERGRTEDESVPPLRNLGVNRHETGVDIRLLVHSPSGLGPDLLAEVKESVGQGGSDGRERQAVGDGEGGGEVERAVRFIGLLVESRVVVDDLGDVVLLSSVGEGTTGGDGEVLGVPGVGVLLDMSSTLEPQSISRKLTWRMGVRNQKKKTNPAMMLASAHQGVARGDPMYAIYSEVSNGI